MRVTFYFKICGKLIFIVSVISGNIVIQYIFVSLYSYWRFASGFSGHSCLIPTNTDISCFWGVKQIDTNYVFMLLTWTSCFYVDKQIHIVFSAIKQTYHVFFVLQNRDMSCFYINERIHNMFLCCKLETCYVCILQKRLPCFVLRHKDISCFFVS